MDHISLFVITGERETDEASNLLHSIPDIEVETITCPPTMKERFVIPYLQDGTGLRFSGIEAIRRFARLRLERQRA